MAPYGVAMISQLARRFFRVSPFGRGWSDCFKQGPEGINGQDYACLNAGLLIQWMSKMLKR
jgi:hypothetical protein